MFVGIKLRLPIALAHDQAVRDLSLISQEHWIARRALAIAESGFVRAVVVRDGGRQWTMSTDEFRRITGRRLGWNKVLSQTFTITRRGEQLIFRGKGFGSQVGLCLAGAVAQAQAGRRYEEILRFYFPRAEISSRRRVE